MLVIKLSAAVEMHTAELCGAVTLTQSDGPDALQDEVLSHRLGLVPVRVDPDLFDSKSGWSAAMTQISTSFGISDKCGNHQAVWLPQLRLQLEWNQAAMRY